MICTNCGKELPDEVKFCRYCGSRVEKPIFKVCPECGRTGDLDEIYCENCGTLMVDHGITKADHLYQNDAVSHKADINNSNQSADIAITVLKRLNLVSQYDGEPTVGVAKATGELCVYNDRIVFTKKLGSSLGPVFGLFGMAIAQKDVKNNPVNVYPFIELEGVHVGKYAGVYNTLVLVLKNGSSVSFVTALPGSSDPEEIVNLIRHLKPGL